MKTKLLTIILIATSVVMGATITSLGTGVKGNLDDDTKWAGGVAPSDNDSFVIANADTITIRYPFTGKFSMDSARSTRYNQLVVNAKFTLTGRCDLRTYNTLDVNDTLDLAGNAIYYKTTSTTASRYNFRFRGSLGDSAVVMSAGTRDGKISPVGDESNSSSIIDFKYCKFIDLYTSKFKSNATGLYFNVTHCLFDSCRYFKYLVYSTNLDSTIYNYNIIKKPADTLVCGWLSNTDGTVPATKKQFIGNIIDYGYQYRSTISTQRFLTFYLKSFTLRHNRFVCCQPSLANFSGSIDSNFFYGVYETTHPANVEFKHNIWFSPFNNPHGLVLTGSGTADSCYIEYKYDTLIDTNIKGLGMDYGDFFITPTTATNRIANCVFNGTGDMKPFFGSIYIFLNSTMNSSANIYNNTVVMGAPFTYGIIRNENSGMGGSGITKVYNNIFYARNSGNGYIVRFERAGEPDQIDSMDYNNVYNFTDPIFTNFEITGKDSGDVWFNSVLPKVDPAFTDKNWCLTKFVHSKGYDSTTQGIYQAFVDSINFIDTALAQYKVAYTPSNATLDGTGLNGTDYGAVDFDAAAKTPASITSQPADTTVFQGDSALFKITATGTNLQYKVYRNADSIGNADSVKFKTTYAMNGDSIRFEVWSADTGSHVFSNWAHLTVTPPTWTLQPVNNTVSSVGKTVEFTATHNFDDTVTWYEVDNPTLIIDSNTLTFEASAADTSKQYYAKASYNSSDYYSDTVRFIIDTIIILTQPVSDTTTGTAQYSISAYGRNLHYAWYRQGVYTGISTATYSFTATSAMDNDSIQCVAYNGSDTVGSDVVRVRVVYAVFDSVNAGDSNTVYMHGFFPGAELWTGTIGGVSQTNVVATETNQAFLSETKLQVAKKQYKINLTNSTYSLVLNFGSGGQRKLFFFFGRK